MSTEFDVLFTPESIQKRIGELGEEITRDYQGKDLVVVGVLNGAFVFMADLVRAIRLPLSCEFVRISSYGSEKVSSGQVQMSIELAEAKIRGRHVLLVEDIVDTGNSIVFLLDYLQKRSPASVKVCSLLLKEAQLRHAVKVDYLAFRIDPVFVIGYGLDLDQKYRNLPYVGIHP